MAQTPILRVQGLTKRYGALVATDDVTLAVNEGECHAVIGPNGAGKTTLVGLVSGEIVQDAGTIELAGVNISRAPVAHRARQGISRTFQVSSVIGDFTALGNVATASQGHAGHSYRFWRSASRDPSLIAPARELLARVGLAERADHKANTLAYGDRRVLEIAMALAGNPRLLLLDEPLAGVAGEEAQRLVRLLSDLKKATSILLVEHDMEAVFALGDRISVMASGRIIATGTPRDISASAEVRAAYLGDPEPGSTNEGIDVWSRV